MNLETWFRARGPRFVWQRATALLDRYGLASAKAIHRIEECVETLAELGCAPTFPTPGIVVQRYPQVIHRLQDAGAEIAVHSYQHINLRELPVAAARQQLVRAIQTFERFGIEVHGFRCPYLSSSTELLDSLPGGMFAYSSNEAIGWEPASLAANKSQFFETLGQFYKGRPASNTVCLPSTRFNLIEIPVCVPDDLQLYDGLQLDSEGMAHAWSQMLDQVHQRGELFTLMFHPELASLCSSPFVSLLRKASQAAPPVWIARLRDVSDWWREKSGFKVESAQTSTGLRLSFTCSPRATILVRGLDIGGLGTPWDGAYSLLRSTTLEIPAHPRPFVGLAPDVPDSTVSFLRDQGYILDHGQMAIQCGTYVDAATLANLGNEIQLINYIETSVNPLVRYWRWPDGAKSALCITGDLDALSLRDYASRLFAP